MLPVGYIPSGLVAYVRSVLSKMPRTLREIETNRVVKKWEDEDRAIYECLLVQGSDAGLRARSESGRRSRWELGRKRLGLRLVPARRARFLNERSLFFR